MMKYHRISLKKFYEGEMVSPSADGNKIPNAEDIFKKMKTGEVINNLQVLDYFYLKSFDKEENWEWMLGDVHSFIGIASYISSCWLISKKLKELIEQFNIPTPHFFYRSKLFYKDRTLDYYVFQFTGDETFKRTLSYINFSNTIFWDPLKEETIAVKGIDEFLSEYKRVYKQNGSVDKGIKNKYLVIKDNLDFFPLGTFLRENLVSERLKNAMEDSGITGLEFSELDYDVIIDKN